MVKARGKVIIQNFIATGWAVLTLAEYRLPPNMRMREKVFSALAIFSSVVSGVGLILLSVFDTKRYPTLHRAFLLVFMLGVWFTAIFAVAEVRHW